MICYALSCHSTHVTTTTWPSLSATSVWCTQLTACGVPYIKSSPSSAGDPVGVAECVLSSETRNPSQVWALDATTGSIKATNTNASLCIAGTNDDTCVAPPPSVTAFVFVNIAQHCTQSLMQREIFEECVTTVIAHVASTMR